MFKSLDGGAHWAAFDAGMGRRLVLDLVIDPANPSTLHAGTIFHGAFGITQAEPCLADATTLCIDGEPGDQRFRITLRYATVLGGGREGDATATPLAPLGVTAGGLLSFFSLENPEVLVKVLDGCGFNHRFWVFYSAATSVGFTLTVEDTQGGGRRIYANPDLTPASTVTDTDAFATCSL